MALRFHLLGGARLEIDGRPVSGAPAQPRRIALLVLLVRAPRRTIARERLLWYLWPDSAPEAARRVLTEAIYVLRRHLGEDVITAVGDELVLTEALTSDVDDFVGAVRAADHERAVELYHGPFLGTFQVREAVEFERWAEAERVELREQYRASLWATTEQRETSGDWGAAAAGWEKVVALDELSTPAVLRFARAQAMAGERARALRTLQLHATLLHEELGVPPDASHVALEREIREGKFGVRTLPSAPEQTASRLPRPDEGGEEQPSSPIDETTPIDAVAVEAPSSTRFRGLGAVSVVAIGALVVLAAVLLGGGLKDASHRTPDASRGSEAFDPRRIAVLYFDDQTPDHSLRHVADGLTEELIRELADVPSLRVLSKDATSRFRSGTVPADSVGRLLHAGTVIGASIRESTGRIRVVARIVDVATREQVATVLVEQPRGELFALEDSLAARTAAALRRRLGDAVRLRAVQRAAAGRRNDRALDLMLRAERLRKDAEAERSSLRGDTAKLRTVRDQLSAADSMLALAESLDPSWWRPSLERGWVAATAGRVEHGATRVVALAPGFAHAERALATLRGSAPADTAARASALFLRGLLRVRAATAVQTFRPERETLRDGEADLEASVSLDSTLAGAWAALSLTRWIRGEFAGAQTAAQRALAADAFLENADEVLGWAWRSAYYLADRDGAMRWCLRGRELMPDDWHFLECELTIGRLDAAGLSRRRPDSRRAWQLVQALERVDPEARASRMGRPYSPIFRRLVAAAVSAAVGERDRARSVLDTELARVRGNEELSTDILYDAAFVYITLGETARAASMLKSYLQARPDLGALIDRDPTMRAATRVAARAGERVSPTR